jgi:hypothetical protein
VEKDEIQKLAGKLDWTRGQTLFLSDRIRNALAVLTSPLAGDEQRKEAQDKLLATIEAIEGSDREVVRVSKERVTTVVSAPQETGPCDEQS